MRNKSIAKTLLALAFLTCFLSLNGAGAWYCEGRPCGISLWFCCCNDPGGVRDANCTPQEDGFDLTAAEGVSTCPADCNCQRIAAEDAPCKVPSAAPFSLPVLAAPPLPLEAPAAGASRNMIARVEARGPPFVSPSPLPLGLRAPPIA